MNDAPFRPSPDARVRHAELRAFAKSIRLHVLRMTNRAGSSHVGSSLSMAELLAVLYGGGLAVDPARPDWPGRDRFILSKGHGCAGLYAALAERGFFPMEWLESFYQNGARLAGHIVHTGVPGVELSTGALGHGLSVGCGMALAAKRDGHSWRTVVLLSDGECDEGSIWEAVLFAPHHRLENLVAIVDYNKIQSLGSVRQVLDLSPLADKWRAFGWTVQELDGHDVAAIERALEARPPESGKPVCILAHTVKGKGVSFMENELLWHYRTPRGEELERALREVEAVAP
ncbi:MAG: transketolase [Candidatus Riflebacteria bacterium]|nr:transketolase [Candidatus Riflebacteria bacterium]